MRGFFCFCGNAFLHIETLLCGREGDQGNVPALINGILIRNDAVNVFLVDRFQTRKKRNGIC